MPDPLATTDHDQQATAAAAFRRFVEVTSTPESVADTPREEYLGLMEPFLANSRHRPHVAMIVDAIAFRQVQAAMKPFLDLLESRLARVVGLRHRYRHLIDEVWEKRNKVAAERQEELLANVSPGEVVLDLLPAMVAETRAEWLASGKQAYELEARIAVTSAGNFIPASVSVSMQVLGETDVQMIEATPKSEIAQLGTMTAEGEVVAGSSHDTKLSAGLEKAPIKLGIEATSTESVQSSQKMAVAGNVTSQRIVSHAVRREAWWKVLRTADWAPIGGLVFSATVLVSDGARELDVAVDADVEFEAWGHLRGELPHVRVPLPAATT